MSLNTYYNMKRFFVYLSFVMALTVMGTSITSCARKSGCPMNEQAVSKPKKNGKFTKGKSQLFDKDTRKRMAKK